MRSEKDFLAGMWRKVELAEAEQLQKKQARERNRRLLKKNIAMYTALLVTFVLLILWVPSNPGFITCICGAYLLLGYILDDFSYKIFIK
ncbi:hypothetical protein [Paenibacillus jilunlii]|uniref:Uncharacterized protein n=1 Tax=Paenibacillus jilunlii TaxID=682956 RepID=A0A1G9SA31_9BACL|nr:hypothetical protein [Paenibacillus jilunlii]KWX75342.1 hypothetical protein AML91_12845 [Paenibacillus jilunlii]SDM32231.1 hypothetical protein SAMN05216191_111131 [Paenibacillus jilunlii]